MRVQHEELVTDFAANVQRILEFCHLEPEPACFEFHKTARAVVSSSSEQVRQPLNRAGLDQWRHFERWLGPLKEARGIRRKLDLRGHGMDATRAIVFALAYKWSSIHDTRR